MGAKSIKKGGNCGLKEEVADDDDAFYQVSTEQRVAWPPRGTRCRSSKSIGLHFSVAAAMSARIGPKWACKVYSVYTATIFIANPQLSNAILPLQIYVYLLSVSDFATSRIVVQTKQFGTVTVTVKLL